MMTHILLFTLIAVAVMQYASASLLDLTADTLSEIHSSKSNDMWLVEFYAPWCKHCQHLLPILEEVATELDTNGLNVRIGKIDAVEFKKEIKAYESVEEDSFSVRGFPTLMLRYGNSWHRYPGERTKDSILSVFSKMSLPASTLISSVQEDLAQTFLDRPSEAVFVLIPGNESEEEQTRSASLFQSAADKLKFVAGFAVLKENADSPVSRSGSSRVAKVIAFGGNIIEHVTEPMSSFADVNELSKWMDMNNHVLLTTFTNSNFKRLGSLQKRMVIAVVDPNDQAVSGPFLERFTAEAGALPPATQTQLVMGTLDGNRWNKFLTSYHAHIPSILVLDNVKESHFVSNFGSDSEGSSSTEIKDLMLAAVADALEMTVTTKTGFFSNIYNKSMYQFNRYYPYSLFAVVPFVLIILSCFTAPPKPSKDHNE